MIHLGSCCRHNLNDCGLVYGGPLLAHDRLALARGRLVVAHDRLVRVDDRLVQAHGRLAR